MASIGGAYTKEEAGLAYKALCRRLKRKRGLSADLKFLLVAAAAIAGAYGWVKIDWTGFIIANSWVLAQPKWVFDTFVAVDNVIEAPLFGAVVAGLAMWLICTAASRLLRHRPQDTPIGSDHAYPRQWSMTLTPESLVSYDGDRRTIAKWSAVDALYRCGDHWAFIIQAQPDFVDARQFEDAAAERAFIAEALSHMSDAARARSRDAVKFAAEDLA